MVPSDASTSSFSSVHSVCVDVCAVRIDSHPSMCRHLLRLRSRRDAAPPPAWSSWYSPSPSNAPRYTGDRGPPVVMLKRCTSALNSRSMVGARLMRSWQLGSQKKSVIDATQSALYHRSEWRMPSSQSWCQCSCRSRRRSPKRSPRRIEVDGWACSSTSTAASTARGCRVALIARSARQRLPAAAKIGGVCAGLLRELTRRALASLPGGSLGNCTLRLAACRPFGSSSSLRSRRRRRATSPRCQGRCARPRRTSAAASARSTSSGAAASGASWAQRVLSRRASRGSTGSTRRRRRRSRTGRRPSASSRSPSPSSSATSSSPSTSTSCRRPASASSSARRSPEPRSRCSAPCGRTRWSATRCAAAPPPAR